MNEETKKIWFVLLVQDGTECITQHPKHECFDSEKEALAYARQSSREDTDGGERAIYHVMSTKHIVFAKRRVTVQTIAVK
jgi:hypothetical protein